MFSSFEKTEDEQLVERCSLLLGTYTNQLAFYPTFGIDYYATLEQPIKQWSFVNDVRDELKKDKDVTDVAIDIEYSDDGRAFLNILINNNFELQVGGNTR